MEDRKTGILFVYLCLLFITNINHKSFISSYVPHTWNCLQHILAIDTLTMPGWIIFTLKIFNFVYFLNMIANEINSNDFWKVLNLFVQVYSSSRMSVHHPPEEEI